MPDHNHGSQVLPIVTDMGDGSYSISELNLHMPGYWEITVKAEESGKTIDEVMFKFCARG